MLFILLTDNVVDQSTGKTLAREGDIVSVWTMAHYLEEYHVPIAACMIGTFSACEEARHAIKDI